MYKSVMLLMVLGILGGCASTPQERFPQFAQRGPQIEHVAVLVDVLMVDDIDGSVDGVSEEKHRTTAPQLADAITSDVINHGYNAKIVHVNSGLFLTAKDKLVFAKDDKSTDVVVDKPIIISDNQPWTNESVRLFLRETMKKAKEYTGRPGSSSQSSSTNNNELVSGKKTESDLITGPVIAVPKELQYLSDNILLVVQARSSDVGVGKSMGTGMATAMITGLLTGGLYVASMPVSSCTIDMAMIDLHSGEIIWHNSDHTQGHANGAESIQKKALQVLEPLQSRSTSIATTSKSVL